MDDGAENEHVSIQLLKMEYSSGVRQIALTSHFNCENQNLEDFLQRRSRAYEHMSREMRSISCILNGLQLKLGAEVFFSSNLCDIDVSRLCIEETNFLMLELPTDLFPAYFDETIYQIQSHGITPVIAHIERYPYIMSNPNVLCDWIDCGIYAQINARTILYQNKAGRLCLDLLKWNLAHILASDVHSVNKRPPNLSEGIYTLTQRLGQSITEDILCNADLIFNGSHPEIKKMHVPRKILGRWC